MEIGYLMPPVATNLFVAAATFKRPFGQVSRAVLPTLGLTVAALVVFMYVPSCSKGLVNLRDGVALWEDFPWDGKPVQDEAGTDDGTAFTLADGQIVRVSQDPATKDSVIQSFQFTAEMNWARNNSLRDGRRFPFVCTGVSYKLIPQSSTE